MNSPLLDAVKANAEARLKSIGDANGDGKIDLEDAKKIAQEAVDHAAIFTSANPLTGLLTAFTFGVVIALFFVSIWRS